MHIEHGFIGQTGYGKTYFMRSLLRTQKRVIVIDPQAEFSSYPTVFSIKDFRDAINNETVFRLAVMLEDLEDYDVIFKIIYKHIQNVSVAVDEISLFAPTAKCNYWLKAIAQRGRIKKINLLWTTQRPANVSRDISSQAHVITAFRLLEPRDVSYLATKWRNKEGERILSQLPKYRSILVRGENQDLIDFYGMQPEFKQKMQVFYGKQSFS